MCCAFQGYFRPNSIGYLLSLTEKQLREILYDHLVTRRMQEVDYDELSDEAQDALVEYYKLCSGVTMGIGRIDPLTGLWKPLPLAPAEGRHEDQGVAS